MKKIIIPLLMMFIIIIGCSAEVDLTPRAIDPTIDVCPICRMSIIDEHFAAQVIENQGYVESFDDIGCLSIYMRRLLETEEQDKVLALYVKDFETMEWIGAQNAYYVQGQIDTPMSFGIVAFTEENTARKFSEDVLGKPLTWEQVLKEKLTIGLDIEFEYEEFDVESLSPVEVVQEEEN